MAMADLPSIRTLNSNGQYLRTYIQHLLRAGKQLELDHIPHHAKTRKPKLVQQVSNQQVQHMAQLLLDQ
jgi:hypothetical protein